MEGGRLKATLSGSCLIVHFSTRRHQRRRSSCQEIVCPAPLRRDFHPALLAHNPTNWTLRQLELSIPPCHTGTRHANMDITAFTVGNRDAALLIADYNAYRKQLSRQLLALRKRLGRSTNKGQKYSNKSTVTADDVAQNPQYPHMPLHSTHHLANPFQEPPVSCC
jgi:hypothetical protein